MKLGVRAAGIQAPTAAGVSGTVSTAAQHRFVDFVSLTKPRLNLLVLITTLAGLYLAAPEGVETALLGRFRHSGLSYRRSGGDSAAFFRWPDPSDFDLR